MDEVRLQTKDGFCLDARFNLGSSENAVVFLHGVNSHKDNEPVLQRIERELSSDGITTLSFDFRGHGKSTGKSEIDSTISGHITDARVALQFLRQRGAKKIILCATSFGASIATLIAPSEKDVVALALLAPVLSYDTTFFHPTTEFSKALFSAVFEKQKTEEYFELPSGYRIGRCIFSEMNKYDPAKELSAFGGKCLIVHSRDDEKIAYSDVEKVANLASNVKLVPITGTGHWIHEEPNLSLASNLIRDFVLNVFGRLV